MTTDADFAERRRLKILSVSEGICPSRDCGDPLDPTVVEGCGWCAKCHAGWSLEDGSVYLWMRAEDGQLVSHDVYEPGVPGQPLASQRVHA